tara:strand:+ start:1080 stop:1583 length:504 start_codon:yes stop_codon:yes gene_type:complete
MLTTPALPPPEPAPHSRSAPSQSARVPLLAAPDTPFPPPRLPLLLAREAPNGVAVRSTPLLRGPSAAVVGDFVPAARASPESTRKLVAEYQSASGDKSAGTASAWLNPALLLDAPGSVCDGDWPVAPGDYCAQAAWSAVHFRRRVGFVLLLGAWWWLLAAGAGGGRQ